MNINNSDKEQMKPYLTRYVNTITEPDRKNRHMYVCPLCGSGKKRGGRSTGAFSITKGGRAWKCFSCGESGDIFKLIGLYEDLTDFKEQLKRAAEISGISLLSYPPKQSSKQKSLKLKPTQQAEVTTSDNVTLSGNIGRFKSYIENCKVAASKTDYFKSRGFNSEVVKRFNLGYDESARAIVIPYDTAGDYYITRSIEGKQFRKPKSDGTPEPVYNKQALYDGKPCFVCESPIDAISLMVAGEGICNAVAIGGTGSQKLIGQLQSKAPTAKLILSFDLDEAGRKASETAANDLKGLNNIPFTVAEWNINAYDGSRKDANDLFKANPQQLKIDIQANIIRIEQAINEAKAERIAKHNKQSLTERLKEFKNELKKNYTPISTGFNKLDEELDGGFYQGLYVLGAISSLGKTTLLLQIADQIAEQGKDVLYFSLEMGADELISKSISRYTYKLCNGITKNAKTIRGITTTERYNKYSQAEIELIAKATEAIEAFSNHLYIYEGIGSIGVDDIKQEVKEHIELTGNIPLVFIDYIQILAPVDIRASDKQNTDKAVLELKRLSRDFKTTVFAISSFNRDNYSTEVNMSAFKESGALEYGSDVLIGLQPQGMKAGYEKADQKANIELVKNCKCSKERKVEAVILKNRNGRTGGRVSFTYHSLFNCFQEIPDYVVVKDNDNNENPFTNASDSGKRV